jgi:hypothetical protein
MDNEAFAALKSFFTKHYVEYQLVPPHFHRSNAAEHAIQTFKEHVVSVLGSVDPAFPVHLWDRLLLQAELTLNLLHKSRQNQQLSATAHYHRMVDYNKTDFFSAGCKFIAHEKPSQRRAWASHSRHGHSLGPAMHHYRCQNVYISSTSSERIVDTLGFFPHNSPMPQLSSTDRLFMAANDISSTLKHPHPYVPFAQVGDDTITALAHLADIFKNKSQNHQRQNLPKHLSRPLKTNNHQHWSSPF